MTTNDAALLSAPVARGSLSPPAAPSLRTALRRSLPALLAIVAAGCADQSASHPPQTTPAPTPVAQYRTSQGPSVPDDHVPDFATRGFAPFNRQDAIAIALRE
ncbi:MAG: hypothetical protein ACRYG4_26180, partial [Janthinobacterium lividum]